MFVDKPKRKENVFQSELLEGEEILWMGKPVMWKLFTSHDWLLIPFGFIQLLFFRLWLSQTPDNDLLMRIILTVAIIYDLYLIIGRFFYKTWRKKYTNYVVTNRRLLILTSLFGRRLRVISLNTLITLEMTLSINQIGNLVFAG